MVLIDCARTDSFTLSACLFSIQNCLPCLFIHPISSTFAHIPAPTAVSFLFHKTYFPLQTSDIPRQHLPLMALPFLMKFCSYSSPPPPCFVVFPEHVDSPSTPIFLLKSVPTGASQRCHCRMYNLPLTSRCFLQRQNTALVAPVV